MLLTGYDPSATTPETPTADPYPHSTQSKDYAGKNDASSQADYQKAYTAALVASAFFVDDLVAQAGSDWSKVTSLSGCPSLIDLSGQIVTSNDPNDKFGSQGVGSAHYLTSLESLRYSIYFDNQPTASAAAQTVVVTDSLDKTRVDLTGLVLGPISFVTHLVTPPSIPLSLGTFTADVDLRPAQNLIARVSADLNVNTGVLTWKFQSIDPATNQTTTDPLAGFLPPGTEGSVAFTLRSQPNISTGTAIQNQATVVFDVNAPLNTPVWSNTLDNDKPTSHVLALPSTVPLSFGVQWSGADVGSGVANFTVYASDNGGPYAPWLTGTADSQGTYAGVAGHIYSFYSIARDLVGNLENAKSIAEATTQVVTQSCTTNSSSSVGVTRGGFRLNNATQRYVQSLALKNTSASSITGPVSLVLDGLSSNATLFGANGTTACAAPLGSPFFTLSIAGGSLAPGATATAVLEFTNPSNQGITYINPAISRYTSSIMGHGTPRRPVP